MYIRSNFRANLQTYQRVSIVVTSVTFWQGFIRDKMTHFKIGVGEIVPF